MEVENDPPQKNTLGRLNHPFRKENDLNQTSMIMFHVNLQGCRKRSSCRDPFSNFHDYMGERVISSKKSSLRVTSPNSISKRLKGDVAFLDTDWFIGTPVYNWFSEKCPGIEKHLRITFGETWGPGNIIEFVDPSSIDSSICTCVGYLESQHRRICGSDTMCCNDRCAPGGAKCL